MAAELFANNFAVQLAVGCANTDTSLTLASTVPAALQGAGQWRAVITDSLGTEYIIVPGGQAGPTVTGVTRGAEGSTATSHPAGAWVTHTLTAGALFGGSTASVVTASSHYDLDAAHNMMIGTKPASINAGIPNAACFNTALGAGAMLNLTTGAYNTAVGDTALAALTSGPTGGESAGGENTAIGQAALNLLVNGQWNTAVGRNALTKHDHGNANTALGWAALASLAGSSQDENTAVGAEAMNLQTTGQYNTAVGCKALGNQATGANSNTAIGHQALEVASGGGNTALGKDASIALTTNNYTTALGYHTACSADGAVAIGTDHTGAGASSSTQDEIMLGTSNHTVNIPTTGTVGNGASTNLTALAKSTGGGPASDVVNKWIPFRNGATSGFIPFFV